MARLKHQPDETFARIAKSGEPCFVTPTSGSYVNPQGSHSNACLVGGGVPVSSFGRAWRV